MTSDGFRISGLKTCLRTARTTTTSRPSSEWRRNRRRTWPTSSWRRRSPSPPRRRPTPSLENRSTTKTSRTSIRQATCRSSSSATRRPERRRSGGRASFWPDLRKNNFPMFKTSSDSREESEHPTLSTWGSTRPAAASTSCRSRTPGGPDCLKWSTSWSRNRWPEITGSSRTTWVCTTPSSGSGLPSTRRSSWLPATTARRSQSSTEGPGRWFVLAEEKKNELKWIEYICHFFCFCSIFCTHYIFGIIFYVVDCVRVFCDFVVLAMDSRKKQSNFLILYYFCFPKWKKQVIN